MIYRMLNFGGNFHQWNEDKGPLNQPRVRNGQLRGFYHLVAVEENIDIDPTSENLLKTIEDFEVSAKLDQSKLDSMNRSDQKKAIAFRISTDHQMNWKVGFLDMLLYYQLYRNWDDVAKHTGDQAGSMYLKPYIEEWIARDFQPEDYKFKYTPNPSELVKKFVSTLNSSMDGLAIHNSVYDFAKANGIEGKAMFTDIYRSLIGKDKGPRAGKLIAALGVQRLKKDLGV